MRHIFITVCVILFCVTARSATFVEVEPAKEYGTYYRVEKTTAKVPSLEKFKKSLPVPVLDGNPDWVEMYWKCWEFARNGLRNPAQGSPLVSPWLDEAFTKSLFQWDTIFMMMFARYGTASFPMIKSLDNFYARQRPSGYICRQIDEATGKEIFYKSSAHTINPPLFAWAEVESFHLTGDKSRFERVLPVLEKYAEWLNRDGDPDAADWEANGRISEGTPHRLYWNTNLGSGMDDSPRPTAKGCGWVEMSSQMVIMYNNMAIMAEETDQQPKAVEFRHQAQAIAARINQWCWNEEVGFYFDVDAQGRQFKVKTMGGFWPLLAKIASPQQAERLVAHLKPGGVFWRDMPYTSLATDEKAYHKGGHYWKGAVWAPTNVMITKGLENYGYEVEAAAGVEAYLTAMLDCFRTCDVPNTVWENYAPEKVNGHIVPGYRQKDGVRRSKPNFVGWTGCGPIQLLFENVMGLRPDGVRHVLTWKLRRTDRHGVSQYPLGSNQISLICGKRESADAPAELTVNCKEPFTLHLERGELKKTFTLKAGSHTINF